MKNTTKNKTNKRLNVLDAIFIQNKIETNRYDNLDPYYAIMLSKELNNLINCL